MPLILKNETDRFAFQFGRGSALRSTNETIDELQDQLRSERAQHRFNLAEKERELALVLRELAEVRLELARIEAFAISSLTRVRGRIGKALVGYTFSCMLLA